MRRIEKAKPEFKEAVSKGQRKLDGCPTFATAYVG
jgi:hypothetical protein